MLQWCDIDGARIRGTGGSHRGLLHLIAPRYAASRVNWWIRLGGAHREPTGLTGRTAFGTGLDSAGTLAWNTPIEDHAPKVLRRGEEARGMPIVIMRFSVATAPEIEQFRDDPRGLAERVRQIVEGIEGVRLVDLYFDVGRPVAYAVAEGLDDFRDMTAVSSYLGAEDMVKAIRVEDAVVAVERKRAVRDRLPPSGDSRH